MVFSKASLLLSMHLPDWHHGGKLQDDLHGRSGSHGSEIDSLTGIAMRMDINFNLQPALCTGLSTDIFALASPQSRPASQQLASNRNP